MHSYASIHIHLHSTALTTIRSVWGFQQTVPSQFLMIQNGKIITSTEPKPSARTGIISKSSVQTGIFSKSNCGKPSSDSGFYSNYSLLMIRVPTRDLFIHSSSSFSFVENRVPTRDLFISFEIRCELFIFFVDPSSDLWSHYFIQDQIWTCRFHLLIRVSTRDLLIHSSSYASSSSSLLIRVPTRDLSISFKIRFELCHFHLLIRVPTRDLFILFELWFSSSFSFVDPSSDSWSLYLILNSNFKLFIFFCWSGFRLEISLFIRAQIRALHFLLLIRVPTRDLYIYSSSDSSSSFSFVDPGSDSWSLYFIQALTRTHHSPLLIQVILILRVCQLLKFDILLSKFQFKSSNQAILQFRPLGHPISHSRFQSISILTPISQISNFRPSGQSISKSSTFGSLNFQSSTFRSLNSQFLTFGSLNYQFRPLGHNSQFSISTFESHNFDLLVNQFSISTVRSSYFDLRVIQFPTTNFPISNFDLWVNQSQYPISIIFSCERPFLGRFRGSSFFSHAIQFVHLAPFQGEFEGTRVFVNRLQNNFQFHTRNPLKGRGSTETRFSCDPPISY